ncbi:pheophytinase [Carex littledalei]|uniref:Pheophytinase n=1 Tax=Carex littledalei TaxID=544730 RepID=A0A833VJY4_9POAL|nr:pheophytinase [Carex littledalei]
MAVALLYSPPSHISFSSPKPHIFSYNASSHFSRHFNTAQTVRFPSKTRCITPVAEGIISRELSEIYQSCNLWNWRGFNISYLVKGNGPGPPLLLVHGFGASIAHWRRNIDILSEKTTVYAIDLLGFGASDKPPGFTYTMETWAELILDFLAEVVKKPTVLVGNSVGSLACVIAASGMNNKAIVDDWRIKLILPLLWLVDFLLKQRRIASAIFERVKQRENLKNILISVYGNKEAVDDDLVEIIKRPADDDGALDAFVSTVTGPPGPSPVTLMPKISVPVLVLWGDEDPFTPLDGPVGKYFSSLPSKIPNLKLFILPGTGHCPHDDRPDLVHEKLIPWLEQLD